MKFSFKKIVVIGMLLGLIALLLTGCTNQKTQIGVFDMTRVINESSKVQGYQSQLDEKNVELQGKINDIEENTKLSKEEKDAQKQEIFQEYNNFRLQLEEKLNKDIEKAVNEIAKEKKLDVIFYKENVRYGGIDITQQVIDKIDQNAENE